MAEFIYKGKIYKRKEYKSFKPFQVRANKFVNKYREFENTFTQDISQNIYTTIIEKDLTSGLKEDDVNNKTKKFKSEVSKFIKKFPNYTALLQEMQNKQSEVTETFLNKTENAKELLDILFEDTESINHEPSIDEAANYKAFLKECFVFFSILYKKLTPNAKSI